MTLEQVLADYRGDAAVLRRRGHAKDAELIERLCDAVADAAEDFLTWLSEDDAMLRSGRSRAWLRAQFADWSRGGNARKDGARRVYRQAVIPQRANALSAREAGREAGRRSA